jgi:1,4-dihydroxy-2-naphthoate octaprenyltransferase
MPVCVTLLWLLTLQEDLPHSLTTRDWCLGIWALVNIIFVHAAGNVWSDYFDYRRGVDASDTYGVRQLVEGHFQPREFLRLSLGLQIVAILAGIALVCLTGLPLLYIGIAGILLSLLYPPLKYSALGDLVILCCYGILPTLGTTYIVTGQILTDILWLAVPIGSITVAILHVNNTRDIETDRRAGIHTFATLTGRGVAAVIYILEILLPYVWIPMLIVKDFLPLTTLTVLISLPLAIRNVRTMLKYKQEGIEAIARLDERTAQLQLVFSVLLMVGLAISL